MDILIIANFCMDFSESDNGRFSYLANMLAEQNNQVELVTSDFYHITKKHREYQPKVLKYDITFIHEPGYPRNVCLKRFYSHKIWANNLIKYLSKRKKPDVVYCAVPSLDGPKYVGEYCENNNIRFIIDIQDLWPEAFQMVFNIPIISNIVFYPFKEKAEAIYKCADAICAVSDTYCQRALTTNEKCNHGTTVFLGTELATYDKYAKQKPILTKKDGEVWVAYCGTLGSSYDLTVVIDALAILNDKRVRLIVMGDGPRFDEFKNNAIEKKIQAEFVGRLSYNKMCALLSTCDITVNPIAHMAAQSIINKHADYAASGLPVVSTQENREYRQLVEDYDMGFNCNNSDPEDLAKRIKSLVEDEELRKRMGKNARRCAEERFDRRISYKVLCDTIIRE